MNRLSILTILTLLTLSLSFPLSSRQDRLPNCLNDTHCTTPQFCLGTFPNLKCRLKRTLGMNCGTSTLICADGLTCSENQCRGLTALSGRCTINAECISTLLCAGTAPRKRCVNAMVVGGRCGNDPKWVCGKGLGCRRGTCKRIFRMKGERCDGVNMVCGQGMRCVGGLTNKRCFLKRTLGEKCGLDPFWVCVRGLRCVAGFCMTA